MVVFAQLYIVSLVLHISKVLIKRGQTLNTSPHKVKNFLGYFVR